MKDKDELRNKEQTGSRLPSTCVNHYRHRTNDSFTTLTLETNRTEWPDFTDRTRPIDHDRPTPLESYNRLHHGKTDQSVYINRTKNTQLTTTITWLWWWHPLRLSKRQSLLPITVLFGTTLTRTITPRFKPFDLLYFIAHLVRGSYWDPEVWVRISTKTRMSYEHHCKYCN